jgi:hypothetical protein
MNVEIGAEAALFPEKEYINRIYFPCIVDGEAFAIQVSLIKARKDLTTNFCAKFVWKVFPIFILGKRVKRK